MTKAPKIDFYLYKIRTITGDRWVYAHHSVLFRGRASQSLKNWGSKKEAIRAIHRNWHPDAIGQILGGGHPLPLISAADRRAYQEAPRGKQA